MTIDGLVPPGTICAAPWRTDAGWSRISIPSAANTLFQFCTAVSIISKKVAGGVMKGGTIPQLIVFTKNAEGKWDRQQLTGAQSEQAVEQMIDDAIARQAKAETTSKQVSLER